MHGHVVQQSMRNEHNMLGLEQLTHRGEQFVVQALQVRPRRLQQRALKCGYVLWIKAELGKLELEHLQDLLYARRQRDRQDVEIIAGEHARENAVLKAKKLDQGGSRRKRSANFFKRCMGGRLQASLIDLSSGGLL